MKYLVLFDIVTGSNCVKFSKPKNVVADSTLHQLLTGNWHARQRIENCYFKSHIGYRQTRIPSHFTFIAILLSDEVTLLFSLL